MLDSRIILKENGVVPNKALGQNFLVDENAVERIVKLCRCDGLPVLEIGPGLGSLTSELVRSASHVTAVEIDGRMVELLTKYAECDNLNIMKADFIKLSSAEINHAMHDRAFIAAGNLPYYITAPICQKLLDDELSIIRMVLMMQEEAAERLTAKPSDRNYVPLTVLAQQKYDISLGLKLSPASYYPAPDVNSVVMVFEPGGRTVPRNFSKVVKASFAMRRKTLMNNLQALADKAKAAKILEMAELAPSTRAETLTIDQFVMLTESYNRIMGY